MTSMLLIAFTLECGLLLAWGLRRPGRLYQFPFLAGATFATFALPQVYVLAGEADLPPGGLDRLLCMTIFCAGMCYAGYVAFPRPVNVLDWDFDVNRLLLAAAALSAAGAFFFYLIRQLPEEMTGSSQWSGLPVAYAFFARLGAYGFALAVLVYFRTGRKATLPVILFDCLVYFDRIVVLARRGEAVEFALCLLLGWWFGRRRLVPRWVMLTAVLFGLLPLYAIGAYRNAVYQGKPYGATLEEAIDWRRVAEIDFADAVRDTLANESHEMRNALYHLNAKARTGDFDLGLSFWNQLVFAYVPAQVFGADFKASLMADLQGGDRSDPFAYEDPPGSTFTGMSDTFEAFSYLGCLVFFLIGLVLRQSYEGGMRGRLAPQLIYVLTLTSALHSITHHSMWFFLRWVHLALFLLPVLWWAKTSSNHGGTEPAAVRLPARP
jgi:hypothetical protein